MELRKLINIQNSLKKEIILKPFNEEINYVLAVDSSYLKKENFINSVAIIYDVRNSKVIEKAYSKKKITFPYIPGFLSFREIDSTLDAIGKIRSKYEIIVVDGQGIAHPRGFGFACHVGVIVKKPTIGCAKSKLIGTYNEPEMTRGSFSFLYHHNKVTGAVLRTKNDIKPLFISPGNLIDVDSSIKIILQLTTKYRQPEPIRAAHLYAGEIKKHA